MSTPADIEQRANAMLGDHGVYLEFPYGRGVERLIENFRTNWAAGRITEAIILTAARTDTRWWKSLTSVARVVCFVDGRLKFEGFGSGAPFPSAVAYAGTDSDGFARAFEHVGDVRKRLNRPGEG